MKMKMRKMDGKLPWKRGGALRFWLADPTLIENTGKTLPIGDGNVSIRFNKVKR
jgi:hypothetical protein